MKVGTRYRSKGRDICLADDDLSEEQNERHNMKDAEENINPNRFPVKAEPVVTGVMKTKLKDRRSLMKRQGSSRRRRRSSARFLKIVPCDDDNEGGYKDGITYDGTSTTNLGEVYRKAIRMNAENRINASNSWNLNLIDHLDRFVAPELHGTGDGNEAPSVEATNESIATNTNGINNLESTMNSPLVSGVNFTKASCTLDASVKIYSYRVDDVHLTSYKVLANLNRTDTNTCGSGKNSANSSDSAGDHSLDDEREELSSKTMKSRACTNTVDTLELNTANINIHKLDAAFDIDPLFHKMSKTFDEGGAKGLLLANLGVGYSGCSIVFDSTLDNDNIAASFIATNDKVNVFNPGNGQTDKDGAPSDINVVRDSNFAIQVTGLICKLESLLSDSSRSNSTIENMPLVPQLSSLRNQYADLGKDGFVEEVGISSKCYASSHKDEVEADKSIHLEAIERSRVSQADLGTSRVSQGSLGSYGSHEDADYDESSFDYGANDDDIFRDLHNEDHRFSSSSFAPARVSFSSFGNFDSDSNLKDENTTTQNAPMPSSKPVYSQAIALLDAIASGDISTEPHNHYEYFNSQALKTLSSGNIWAGAEHWKKMPCRRRRDGAGVSSSSESRNRNDEPRASSHKKKGIIGKTSSSSTSNTILLVSVSKPIERLEAMLEKPKRGRGKNTADLVQLTKAMRSKYSKNDNLLPLDAELGVHQFITLFSRPNENLIDFVKAKRTDTGSMNVGRPTKVVGFCGVETFGAGDDVGTGLDFGGIDDGYDETDDLDQFVVPKLSDIRKVDKINIGYATVARKIDVKRLKRDLWTELEQTFSKERNSAIQEEETRPRVEEDDRDSLSIVSTTSDRDLTLLISNDESTGKKSNNSDHQKVTPLSFQDTVRDMQTNESQLDVTVPFYFICILHLCNEKGLALESSGLHDFVIRHS